MFVAPAYIAAHLSRTTLLKLQGLLLFQCGGGGGNEATRACVWLTVQIPDCFKMCGGRGIL
jgi:hypothetical protein